MFQTTKMQFGYRRHTDQDRAMADAVRHPVLVVGAGPVGLSLAIDLAQRGQNVVLLDDADRIGDGSRAICFSKRSLELWDRLGIGERVVEKGVVWKVGKIFLKEELQVYEFDLLPEDGHKRPAFVNLQQYLRRSVSRRSCSGTSADRSSLAKQSRRHRTAQRPCGRCDRNP